jgi:hypothetical protein
VLSPSPHAQSPISIIRRFPVTSVALADDDGTLYGVGGAGVYGLTPDNQYFWDGVIPSGSCAAPVTSLIKGWTGLLYAVVNCAVFSTAPDFQFTLVHDFGTSGSETGLVQGADGNLYGTIWTTVLSGDAYRLTPDGVFSLIHHFQGTFEPTEPGGPCTPAQGDDGWLYGKSSGHAYPNDAASLWAMTLDGTQLQTLMHFYGRGCGGTLIQARDGIYGTQYSDDGPGFLLWWLFRFASDGTAHYLQTPFCMGPGGLVEGPDGVYTTLFYRHRYGCVGSAPAQIVRLAPDDTMTTVYTFDGSAWGILDVLGPDGLLYGHGRDGSGSFVFRFDAR